MNPLKQLHQLGQSIWLDYVHRDLITSGELQHLIADDGLMSMTSNPNLFEKAIAESDDYEPAIRSLALAGKSANEIYEALSMSDVRDAADLFRPIYNEIKGRD